MECKRYINSRTNNAGKTSPISVKAKLTYKYSTVTRYSEVGDLTLTQE